MYILQRNFFFYDIFGCYLEFNYYNFRLPPQKHETDDNI